MFEQTKTRYYAKEEIMVSKEPEEAFPATSTTGNFA